MLVRLLYRLWAFLVNSARFWEAIEGTGIAVFVGPNGSGKSLVMVESEKGILAGREWSCFDVEHRHHKPFMDHQAGCSVCDVPALLAWSPRSSDEIAALVPDVLCQDGAALIEASAFGERLVYSTVPLTAAKGVPHPLYVPLRDYQQLLAIEHAEVLFDEVAGIADASGSASMPVQVINWQHKLRKADVRQRVTTPAYGRCALPIRQVAQVVVECRSLFPVRARGLLWRPRRVVLATAYDAFQFEDFVASEGQRNKLKPLARALIWVPDSFAVTAYNSFGQVLQLGHVTDSGMCITCGGTRARPKCGCETDHSDLEPGTFAVETVQQGASRIRRVIPQSPA